MSEPAEAERQEQERDRRETRDVVWLRFRARFGPGWWRRLIDKLTGRS